MAERIDLERLQQAKFKRAAPVALIRSSRSEMDVTTEGTSWYGGVPALGDTPWPLDSQGRPLHHIAQIDLSRLDSSKTPKGLPSTGSLAFFFAIGGDPQTPAQVVYLRPKDGFPTAPPNGIPSLCDGHSLPGVRYDEAPVLLPRWSLDLITMPDEYDRSDMQADLDRRFPKGGAVRLEAYTYRDTLPKFANPYWWHSAQCVTNALYNAISTVDRAIARHEAQAETHPDRYQPIVSYMHNHKNQFIAWAKDTINWTSGQDPWAPMPEADKERLNSVFAQLKRPRDRKEHGFYLFYQYAPGTISLPDDAVTESYLALARAEPETFAHLPEQIQQDIDAGHRLLNCQMFGEPQITQTAGEDHKYDHLLLQIDSDQLMGWERGTLQYWISPNALKQANWTEVEVTLETG